MEEIASKFKEEYTELLSRYKDKLTNTQIMSILQSVTKKQIGFKDNPERLERIFNNAVHNLPNTNGLKVPADLIAGPDTKLRKMLRGEFNDNKNKNNNC